MGTPKEKREVILPSFLLVRGVLMEMNLKRIAHAFWAIPREWGKA